MYINGKKACESDNIIRMITLTRIIISGFYSKWLFGAILFGRVDGGPS